MSYIFRLTRAQKFKYQPSHLNVKQVQNHISQATEASYMYVTSFVVKVSDYYHEVPGSIPAVTMVWVGR